MYELWSLRRQPKLRAIRTELDHQFSGLDLHRSERVSEQSDIFGETPLLTIYKLLSFVEVLEENPPSLFVDLGGGRGMPVLVASSLGYRSSAWEKEAAWVEKSRLAAQNLGFESDFLVGDFLTEEWPNNAIYYAAATAFSLQTKTAILEQVRKRSGLLITADWRVEEGWQLLWTGRLPVDWGIVEFYIYQLP